VKQHRSSFRVKKQTIIEREVVIFEFFSIAGASGNSEGMAELNKFISTNRIIKIDKLFDSSLGCWLFCIEYIASAGGSSSGAFKRKEKIDYKSILSQEEYGRFIRWKTVRDVVAARINLKCYEVFYNEEIAELSKKSTVSIEDLKGLRTFDDAKITKMGEVLIDLFNKGTPQQS